MMFPHYIMSVISPAKLIKDWLVKRCLQKSQQEQPCSESKMTYWKLWVEGSVSLCSCWISLQRLTSLIRKHCCRELIIPKRSLVKLSSGWNITKAAGPMHAVVMNNSMSSVRGMPFGIPQGSVLRPKAFSKYIQTLGAIICKHQMQFIIYANDNQMYSLVKLKDNLGG